MRYCEFIEFDCFSTCELKSMNIVEMDGFVTSPARRQTGRMLWESQLWGVHFGLTKDGNGSVAARYWLYRPTVKLPVEVAGSTTDGRAIPVSSTCRR